MPSSEYVPSSDGDDDDEEISEDASENESDEYEPGPAKESDEDSDDLVDLDAMDTSDSEAAPRKGPRLKAPAGTTKTKTKIGVVGGKGGGRGGGSSAPKRMPAQPKIGRLVANPKMVPKQTQAAPKREYKPDTHARDGRAFR